MHYTVAYGLQNTQIILSQTQTIALFFFTLFFFLLIFKTILKTSYYYSFFSGKLSLANLTLDHGQQIKSAFSQFLLNRERSLE